jgi:hypothetical protein
MPGRKQLSRRKRPVKRLLDDILPKRSPQSKVVVRQLVDYDDDDDDNRTPRQSFNEVISPSSSTLKRVEEKVTKDKGASPDPTLPSQPSSTRVEHSQQQQSEKVR